MRVADYVFQFLADRGTRHVFFVSGGGAMHLNDALGKQKQIRYICNLHEQACSIAAEGYARISNLPGVVNVTTGPGGTNAVTGVMGAWVDSIPMFVVSGQVKTSTTIAACPELKLRALGDQEINIVDIVKPITKYAVMVEDANEIRYHLEKAYYEAVNGRPGPVWVDIPLNVQCAEIDPSMLPGFTPVSRYLPEISDETIQTVADKLRNAKRPVIIAGNGVTLAGARKEFRALVEKLNIPVLTTISGADVITSDSPVFFGRPGILGERAANFVMQNSDLLLVIGTRMSIRIIGYAYEHIARAACRIMVDADEGELSKPTFKVDLKVHGDAKEFLTKLAATLPSLEPKDDWLKYCRKVKNQYPVILPAHRQRKDYVSSYTFPEILAKHLKGDEVVVTGNGTAYTSTFQALPVKKDMRFFSNVACAAMGYDLPAAIGASFAAPGKKVILITGDGSLQMNIQELQTILNYRLPIKIFVYNNDGYLSIKLTQNAFFNGNLVGSTPSSGVVLPDMEKIAKAYGYKYYKFANHTDAEQLMSEALAGDEPIFCEVMTDPLEVLGPKAASAKRADGTMVSKPLEDLFPFLDRKEFLDNMLIDPVADDF